MKQKIFTLLIALVALAANATVIKITPTSPEPADNLRLAVERAQTGDIIEMAEGTYVESNGNVIAFSGKEVTVRATGEVLLQVQEPIIISEGGKAELIGIQIDASHLNDVEDCYEHVIYASDADANNRLVMKDCVLKNFLPNSSAIFCSASNKLASIEIDGCYIHDIMKSVIFIESTDSTNLTVTNSTIANVITNTESYWAGIIDSRATKGDVLVDHCTFYNAIPMNTDYGAIGKIKTAGKTLVSNSIFMLPEAKDGIRCIRDVKEAKNCLVFNYVKDSNWGIHSSVTKTDCINDKDPLFKDAANGDFTLLDGSPALTAGENGGPIGAPRWYSNISYGFDSKMGFVEGPIWAQKNTTISFEAIPGYGYHFTQWSDGITDNPRTIEFTRDTTFTAEFAKNPTITYVYDALMGIVEGPTVLAYDIEGEISFSAKSNYGYHFVQWSDGITDNPRIAEITQDTTFFAEFAKNKYTVTTSSSNPDWGTTIGDTTVYYLDSVEVSANPNYGYYLSYWHIEFEEINNVSPNNIVARFSVPDSWPDTYAWIWGLGESGHWEKLPYENGWYVYRTNDTDKGIILVPYGAGDWTGQTTDIYLTESACYTIEDNGGYNYPDITKSYDCIKENSNKYLLRVEGNTTMTAVFAQNIYSITKISDTEQGAIEGPSQAGYLDSVSLEAVPYYGYHFVQWSDGITDNPRTVAINQDTTFTAEFALDRIGKCGTDLALTWTYEPETKVLTISGDGAFDENMECGIEAKSAMTHLVIEDGVTSIGDRAFYNCSGLTSVIIPNSVTSIGNESFYNCIGLTSVQAPAMFFNISENIWLYYTKNLHHVCVNAGELNENELLFINRSYKTLQSLDVEAVTNTDLADEAFKGYYNLETLKLPANLTQINYMAVAECVNLTTIAIPESVEEIEQRAFENCRSITSIEFGENPLLTSIGAWAFYNCHELANIDIPEGVIEIGKAAFYGCTYAQAAHLPASVQSIGDNAFALCSKLTRMDVDAVLPPEVENKTFYEVPTEAPVYVPEESADTYKSHAVWGRLNIQGRSNAPTAIDNNIVKENATKILRDGQIFILRGDKTYTLTGQEVK